MGLVRSNRRGALGIVALALIASLAALALTAAEAAPQRRGPDQRRLLLRLVDLPYGYVKANGNESKRDFLYCSPLSYRELSYSDNTLSKLTRFILRFHPSGCIAIYSQLFALPGMEPGPTEVATAAMALDSDPAADAAWSVVPELLGGLHGDRRPLHEIQSEIKVGSATRLFHLTDKRLPRSIRYFSNLVWRSGNTLAAVGTLGPKPSENDRHAAELAQLQQVHIQQPTRYTRAERFDGEVPLDDPALKHPVYWLGHDFKPAELPPLSFVEAEQTEMGRHEKAGKEVHIEYAGLSYEYLHLDEWSPRQWKVFQRSKLSRPIVSWRCTQTRTVQLPEGTAIIYAGYDRNYASCPSEPPTVFTARIAFPGVFVAVNPPTCLHCASQHGSFGSYEAMEAIVVALALRPQRTS
jgi:hypothetical protein